MADAKGEVLLRTKPGCYLGVKIPGSTTLYFGEMSRYNPDANSIEFSRYARFNTKTFSIEEVVEEPRIFPTKAEDIILGKTLLWNVGGDEKANELLDALEHRFDERKYRAYLHVLREEKRARKLEEKRKKEAQKLIKPQRKLTPMLKEGGERVAEGLATGALVVGAAAGLYFHGYFPWAYKYFDKKGDFFENDRHAVYNSVATNVINGIATLLSAASYKGSLPEGAQLDYSNPAVTIPVTIFGLSLVSLGGKAVYEGGQKAIKLWKDYEERQEKRRRLERLRQAFCPDDSERYYGLDDNS